LLFPGLKIGRQESTVEKDYPADLLTEAKMNPVKRDDGSDRGNPAID
jgi:hypothetical protein